VQAVAGVLVTFVACWELYTKRNWFLSFLSTCNKENKDGGGQTGADETAERGGAKVEEVGGGGESNESEKKGEIIITTEVGLAETSEQTAEGTDETVSNAKTQLDSESLDKVTTTIDTTNDGNSSAAAATHPKTTISTVYASLAVEPIISTNESLPRVNNNNNSTPTTEEERLKIGINKATFITLLAGGASGFLGGLVAIRGPPLIFYFLHPPHPITFNKRSQRATGVVIMFCNVFMRMIFYFVNTFSLNSSGKMGFVKEDWRLYLSVIVCSIAGGLVGSKMFEYLRDSQDTIRGILAVFLLLCGVSLLFSAFA